MSSGSRVVPCERTDGWTDMRKLIFAFRNVANAPNKIQTKMYQNRILLLDVLSFNITADMHLMSILFQNVSARSSIRIVYDHMQDALYFN